MNQNGIEIRKIIYDLDEGNLKIVIEWMHRWWQEKENCSKQEIEDWIKCCFQKDKLPMTFGMFDGEKIIGMYQFSYYDDLFSRPDIYPFLANVYIDEKYRNKGYSKILLESVKENFPKKLNFKTIYLYTKYKGLYEKYGWKYIENVNTYNRKDTIQYLYKLDL